MEPYNIGTEATLWKVESRTTEHLPARALPDTMYSKCDTSLACTRMSSCMHHAFVWSKCQSLPTRHVCIPSGPTLKATSTLINRVCLSVGNNHNNTIVWEPFVGVHRPRFPIPGSQVDRRRKQRLLNEHAIYTWTHAGHINCRRVEGRFARH